MSGHGAPGSSGDTSVSSSAPAENASAEVATEDGGDDGPTIAALAVGIVALAAAAAALFTARGVRETR